MMLFFAIQCIVRCISKTKSIRRCFRYANKSTVSNDTIEVYEIRNDNELPQSDSIQTPMSASLRYMHAVSIQNLKLVNNTH